MKILNTSFIDGPYLELPFHLRMPLTKLRISDHSLREQEDLVYHPSQQKIIAT